jgi:hypothetical protein
VTGVVLAVPLSAVVAIDDTKVSPGVLGFVVVALLGLATYLLIRSMNRQIKRIDLPDDDTDGPESGPESRTDGFDGTDDPSDLPDGRTQR